jgi:hypothetical protein
VFRSVCIAAGLLLSLGAACLEAPAQLGMPLNRPDPKLEAVTIRETVARYCRLDYAGARLNQADWPKMQPLVAWQTDPEFTFFLPSSRFDVAREVVPQHGKYLVTVHYRLIGRFDMAQGYSPESADQVDDVQFVVSEVNGSWRITDVQPNYPHPSRAATVQWFGKKLSQAQEPALKLIYQHAMEEMESQKTAAPGP